ncbi:MAG: hypothetical protein NWE89_15490 [Candidatus Bathyarchaeota archaeon]|nr:hypothetical protein [Candidatus Bathyarchaeota archaeon]
MRRGYSDIVSSLILTTIVITIGVSAWGYAQSTSSVMSTNYFDEVSDSVYRIQERFFVESIAVNISSAPSVSVWVTNYGRVHVNITCIKISGRGNNTYYYPTNGYELATGTTARFDLNPGTVPVRTGTTIAIKVVSVRENEVYAKERIP